MATSHIAKEGTIHAAESSLIASTATKIAEFEDDAAVVYTLEFAEGYCQKITRQIATPIMQDLSITIGGVYWDPENLADLLGLTKEEIAARKLVTAISQGATEATLTTEPGSDDSFEDNEQVLVVDLTGWFKAGYIDGTAADTEVDVDNGSGAVVSDIEKVGVGAHLDSSEPHYFTRADNALLNIGNAEDYSVTAWFNRDRTGCTEVLVAKTSDWDGTANGTTAGWVLYIGSDDKLYFAVNDGVDAYLIGAAAEIADGKWHQVTVTFDESDAANCKIYLDGYDNTDSLTGTLANIGDCTNALVFSIGAESDAGVPFDGYIRDVAVHNGTVITAANALTYACTPMSEPGSPSAWWPFYDAAAATVIDDPATAANELDLTLVGGTTDNYGTHTRSQKAYLTANLVGFDWDAENGGLGGWTAGDAATTLKKVTEDHHAGQQGLRVTNGDASQAFARATVTTIANGEYFVRGWFLPPETPNGASSLINVDTTAALSATVTQAGATGTAWTEVEVAFEAADTSTTIDLGSGSATSGQIGTWDNVQIFKNYIDAGGFESQVAGSDWAQTGSPTVDDQDTDEKTGTYCYKVNGDSDNYIKQDVTITSGEVYTFIGYVKCGTADSGIINLSGAATKTLDNDSETSSYVQVKHTFTAATTTLTIKIYGDSQDARFDNFALIKHDWTHYIADKTVEPPDLQFILQYTDSDSKKNQFYCPAVKMRGFPIPVTSKDYMKSDLVVLPIEDSNGDFFVQYVEQ